MTIEEKIVETLEKIIKDKYNLNLDQGIIMVEIPKDNTNGDYSSNIAMRLTKLLSRKPLDIANELKEELINNLKDIDKIEIAGPGFINFWFKKDAIANIINVVLNENDKYGNSVRVNSEDAKAGKALAPNMKIDQNNYRIAYSGEADLVAFLKQYLGVPYSLNYINGTWVVSDKAQEGLFELEKIKDYFNGDFSEVRKAISLQEHNKVKLLYGVRTAETENGTRQYQTIATKGDFILRNNAGSNAIAKLEKDLKSAKDAGSYSTTDFEVCELKEWTVQPTNLDTPSAQATSASDNKMPWD